MGPDERQRRGEPAGEDVCPACGGSDGLVCEKTHHGGGGVVDECRCCTCGAEWERHYRFCGHENVRLP